MIWYFVPGRGDKNIGKSLNEHCELVKNEEDWIVTRDGDTMFLPPFWAKQIEDIIERHGNDYQLFVPVTNRVASLKQRPYPEDFENYDILHHNEIAERLFEQNYSEVERYTGIPAGLMLVFQKKTWTKLKFLENCITFDTVFGRRLRMKGGKIGLMTGLYVFHGYRIGKPNPTTYKKHLLK